MMISDQSEDKPFLWTTLTRWLVIFELGEVLRWTDHVRGNPACNLNFMLHKCALWSVCWRGTAPNVDTRNCVDSRSMEINLVRAAEWDGVASGEGICSSAESDQCSISRMNMLDRLRRSCIVSRQIVAKIHSHHLWLRNIHDHFFRMQERESDPPLLQLRDS